MHASDPLLPLIQSEIDLVRLRNGGYAYQQAFQGARAAYNQNISQYFPDLISANAGMDYIRHAMQQIESSIAALERNMKTQELVSGHASERNQDDAAYARQPLPEGIYPQPVRLPPPVKDNDQAIAVADEMMKELDAEIKRLREEAMCYSFRAVALENYIASLQAAFVQSATNGMKPH